MARKRHDVRRGATKATRQTAARTPKSGVRLARLTPLQAMESTLPMNYSNTGSSVIIAYTPMGQV
eukprot:6199429-Pleurochrysis_carterae.AAC.2